MDTEKIAENSIDERQQKREDRVLSNIRRPSSFLLYPSFFFILRDPCIETSFFFIAGPQYGTIKA